MINFIRSKETAIAVVAIASITLHLFLRYGLATSEFISNFPLYLSLLTGGIPLVYGLLIKMVHREFGSDLLAGIAIVTSVFLGEYLAGTFVVLMLSGGEALESYAVGRASSVLKALAKRMPSIAHQKVDGGVLDVTLDQIQIGTTLVIYPHEVCPIDGIVVEGRGIMDESYLTGEPFEISKTPGSTVLSGAINGHSALTIRATKLAVDSRYAKIMQVMRAAEENRPPIRRLGDQLGALYTPIAVGIAIAAWVMSENATRFLAVLVVATPCPLLIAIPVAIIGSISLAAKRGIIIRDPAALEQINTCKTVIFDKTGTLTYGEPTLAENIVAPGFEQDEVLQLVASVEQYSKHPLSSAVLRQAKMSKLKLLEADEISEPPGQGLRGRVAGKTVLITSRKKLQAELQLDANAFPPMGSGLECVIAIDGKFAALYRFHDAPRADSKLFIRHLTRKHRFTRLLLVSGDRESEVQYLANLVGIKEVYASKSPEEKVQIVRDEMAKNRTVFVGDGINDAPALMTATVGIAFGQNSDITSEAAGAVVLDTTLAKVDEFFHISERMKAIALQCAVGGMALSVVGMIFAAFGYLPPVAGAVTQEIIDVVAIANALRAALPPRSLVDY